MLHQASSFERLEAESQDYYPLRSPRRPSRRCIYSHVVMPILGRPHSGPTMESPLSLPMGTTKFPGPVLAQRENLLSGTKGPQVRRAWESPLVYFALRRPIN